MTHAYLIVGGNLTERKKKIEEIYFRLKPKLKAKLDPDLITLEGLNSLGIEEIRQLEHFLALKPHSFPPKVVVIPEGEKLTPEAQNALLSTLEEPPKETVIILGAQNPEIFSQTIISRCQIIQLPAKPQIVLKKEEVEKCFSELNLILSQSLGERINFAERFKTRQEVIYFCQIQTLLWRELLFQKIQKNEGQFSTKEIIAILKEIQKIKKYLTANVNVRLALENLLLAFPQSSS